MPAAAPCEKSARVGFQVTREVRLGNYRSFRDEHELSLLPAYDREQGGLPVVAIYGANASGKSNVLADYDKECGAFDRFRPGVPAAIAGARALAPAGTEHQHNPATGVWPLVGRFERS